MKEYPKIAVLVAALNEEKHVGECLEALSAQSYPGEIEIIVADGGSSDATKSVVESLQKKYGNITLIDNPKKIQAAGRNLALEKTDAEFVAYMDAHSRPDKNWLRNLYETFVRIKSEDPKIAFVGSRYVDSSPGALAKAGDAAVKSPLCGAGGDVYHNAESVRKVDHSSMCLFPREVIDKEGFFDESLASGEDMELTQRLVARGYSGYVEPSAFFYYSRSNGFADLARRQYRYGFWRLRVMQKLGNVNIKPLAPAFFVLSIFTFLFLGAMFPIFIYVLIGELAVYLGIIVGGSVAEAIRKKVNPFLLTLIVPVIHFSYGIGLLASLFSKSEAK